MKKKFSSCRKTMMNCDEISQLCTHATSENMKTIAPIFRILWSCNEQRIHFPLRTASCCAMRKRPSAPKYSGEGLDFFHDLCCRVERVWILVSIHDRFLTVPFAPGSGPPDVKMWRFSSRLPFVSRRRKANVCTLSGWGLKGGGSLHSAVRLCRRVCE